MSKAKAIRFELQVEGLQERFELTKRSVRKAVRQALSEVGDIYRKAMQDRFDTKGDGKWAELSASTRRRKGHDKILIDKGLLRLNVLLADQRLLGDTMHFRLVGERQQIAMYHQHGTQYMPAREIFVEPKASVWHKMEAAVHAKLEALETELARE
jgi:hypothetical protein